MLLTTLFSSFAFLHLMEGRSNTSFQCGNYDCACDVKNNKFTLNCRGKNFKTLPDFDTSLNGNQTNSIDFGRNSLFSLPENAFFSLTELTTLILDENNIEDISVAAFNVSNESQESSFASPIQYIDLRNNHLHHFPSSFGQVNNSIASLENLETLLISGNYFGASLKMESFAGITNLKILDISNCLVRVVLDLLFKKLLKLESLDLSSNSIKHVSPRIFPQHVPLQVLKLQENNMEQIPKNLPAALEQLNMSSNKIGCRNTNQDLSITHHLINLKILDLSKNQISCLEPFIFENLSELNYLDLSHNNITIIENDVFAKLKNLEILFLEHNPSLMYIGQDTLPTMTKLKHLFVQSCQLKTITLEKRIPNSSEILYPPLKNLWLFDNPLVCDCHMLPLVQFLKRHKVQLDESIDCIFSEINNPYLEKTMKVKMPSSNMRVARAICTKPRNRHFKVVEIPLLNVTEAYLSCPDEPYYLIVSCFLGIIAFVGVIPVVIMMIAIYLQIRSFFEKHFCCKKRKED